MTIRSPLPQYRLVLEVDEAGLMTLAKHSLRIALARSTSGSIPNVVWLTLPPRATNVVTWTKDYHLFGASVPERPGSPISVLASFRKPRDRSVYPFLGDRFAAPIAGANVPRGHYEVRNAAAFSVACGLLQEAVVNGYGVCAPVNAVVLPPDFTADFTGFDIVYVWLQGGVRGGVVAADIPRRAAAVAIVDRETPRVRYDTRTATFVLCS